MANPRSLLVLLRRPLGRKDGISTQWALLFCLRIFNYRHSVFAERIDIGDPEFVQATITGGKSWKCQRLTVWKDYRYWVFDCTGKLDSSNPTGVCGNCIHLVHQLHVSGYPDFRCICFLATSCTRRQCRLETTDKVSIYFTR